MTGSGTQADPYIIETIQDLQDMNQDYFAYYELGNDINASVTATWNDNGDGTFAGFDPIGKDSPVEQRFQGSFDGKGHTISNLYINRPDNDNVGLFGYIHDDFITDTSYPTVIQNLTLKNVDITGNSNVGGLAGFFRIAQAFGHITYLENCSIVGGSITGNINLGGMIGYMKKSYGLYDNLRINQVLTSNLNISGVDNGIAGGVIGHSEYGIWLKYARSINNNINGNYIGGLIGELASYSYECLISNCLVENNTLTGTSLVFWFGGLIGRLSLSTGSGGRDVSINNSYVLNTNLLGSSGCEGYKGGLFGWLNCQDALISNCYTVFNHSGTGSTTGTVGRYDNGSFQDCYWDSELSGVDTDNAPSGTTGLTTAEMKNTANFPNWDFTDIWANDGVTNEGYHYLQAFAVPASLPLLYWDGSSWVNANKLKYWNGSEWIDISVIKYWDGQNWSEVG